MTDNGFFGEQTEQSLIKATILGKYFDAWANVMIAAQRRYPQHAQKIAYIDLFAGPGRYKNGAESTPLKVLEHAIADEEISSRLVSIFNDKDEENARSLETTISKIPGIGRLKFKPKVWNEEVGDQIVQQFESMKLIPTLSFVDPWGYKGLSLRPVNSVLKDWGCDCVFFFNYNRINMGINNEAVDEHMNALFGVERAKEVRANLEGESPAQREQLIVEAICSAIKKYGPRYVLPFCFRDARGTRTSHHLFFVSKAFRGYEIMKEIMAKESTNKEQGVPSFAYNPADLLPKQSLLFELSRPLDDLEDLLIEGFRSQKLTVQEIYERHNIDRPYIEKNYKAVILKMEKEGKVKVTDPKGKKRRPNTLANHLIVVFTG